MLLVQSRNGKGHRAQGYKANEFADLSLSEAQSAVHTLGTDDDSAVDFRRRTNGPCVDTDGAEFDEVVAKKTSE
jgi:hypothetical protein